MESEYLNDIEKEKITAFLKDELLVSAVRKIMLKRIYTDGTLVPGKPANEPYENFFLNIYKDAQGELLSDEMLGQVTRSRRLAIELVQRGFKDLENFKSVKAGQEKAVNKAR